MFHEMSVQLASGLEVCTLHDRHALLVSPPCLPCPMVVTLNLTSTDQVSAPEGRNSQRRPSKRAPQPRAMARPPAPTPAALQFLGLRSRARPRAGYRCGVICAMRGKESTTAVPTPQNTSHSRPTPSPPPGKTIRFTLFHTPPLNTGASVEQTNANGVRFVELASPLPMLNFARRQVDDPTTRRPSPLSASSFICRHSWRATGAAWDSWPSRGAAQSIASSASEVGMGADPSFFLWAPGPRDLAPARRSGFGRDGATRLPTPQPSPPADAETWKKLRKRPAEGW